MNSEAVYGFGIRIVQKWRLKCVLCPVDELLTRMSPPMGDGWHMRRGGTGPLWVTSVTAKEDGERISAKVGSFSLTPDSATPVGGLATGKPILYTIQFITSYSGMLTFHMRDIISMSGVSSASENKCILERSSHCVQS